MHPGPLRDLLTLLLGIGTGVLSALFGVGGAVVSTPGIRALGASAFIAVGTTLPSIFPSAITGTIRYVRERMIDWRVVAWTAPSGLAASIGGSLLSHAVPGHGHWLMVLTALMLAITAWRMARPARPTPPSSPARATDEPTDALVGGLAEVPLARPTTVAVRRRDNVVALATIGVLAGGMSGLLGVGGGVVMVPAFVEYVRLPLKTAIATSLVCVAAFAIPGTVTHSLLGDIDWRFALLLAVAVVPGARLGAALAIRTADQRLRRIVAIFLGVIAVVYAAGEITALLH